MSRVCRYGAMRVAELALFERGNVYILEQDYLALQAALREALELGTRPHLDCEYCFYSCSTLCCDDNRRDMQCNCGADKINARIAELRKFLDDK